MEKSFLPQTQNETLKIKSCASEPFANNQTEPSDILLTCPYHNHHLIRIGCNYREVIRKHSLSLLGPDLSSMTTNLPQWLITLLLRYGIISLSDLSRLLGIKLSPLSVAASRHRNLFLRLRLPRKNFEATSCLTLNSKNKMIRKLAKSLPSAVLYDAKLQKSRMLSHEYSLSLSCLLLSLGLSYDGDRFIEFHRDATLGNHSDAPSRRYSEVAVDCLCDVQVYPEGKSVHLICLEQDMGTENFRVLARKFYDYAQTDYFSEAACERISIIISHGVLTPSNSFRLNCKSSYVVSLALLLKYFHVTILQGRADLINCENVFLLLCRFCTALCMQGKAEEFCSLASQSVKTPAGLDENEIMHLFTRLCLNKELLNDAFTILMKGIHLIGGNKSSVTLEEALSGACHLFSLGDTALANLLLCQQMREASQKRLMGLSLTLCRIAEKTLSFPDLNGVGLTSENSYQFLRPFSQGYQAYLCATPLISNCLPFLTFDDQDPVIQKIQDLISRILPSTDTAKDYIYRHLSRKLVLDSSAPYPALRLRNHFQYTNHENKSISVCIENLSHDIGAAIRARLFCLYYDGQIPIQLILYVEDERDAYNFLLNQFGIQCSNSLKASRLAFKKILYDYKVSPICHNFISTGIINSDSKIVFQSSHLLFIHPSHFDNLKLSLLYLSKNLEFCNYDFD